MSALRACLFSLLLCLVASPLFAGNAPASPAPACTPAAPKSAWEIEHERLLHEDWPELSRFRAANAALPAPRPGESRVVLMGDSITEFWRDTVSPRGPEMGAFFSGRPFFNRGISGQTTPQMLLRFRQDVIELHPAVVVILAGTNDVASNTGVISPEGIEANIATMCELARLHGIRVVLSSILPAADYPWKPGVQPAPKIAALNQWIRSYAAAQGIVYLDYYTPMATPEGGLRRELSGDGVHPNRAGYEVMAPLLEQAVAAALK